MSQRDTDVALEGAILTLLQQREPGKTICPSEASRAVFGATGNEADPMRRTRAAAGRLVARGAIEVTQRGEVVDLGSVRGPIRLRLKTKTA